MANMCQSNEGNDLDHPTENVNDVLKLHVFIMTTKRTSDDHCKFRQ